MTDSHPMQAESNFLLPNATFFAEFIAFLLILWFLWKYVVPPVQKAMADRQAMIEQQVKDAEEAQRQLEQTRQDYSEKMKEARTEAAQIRDGARAEGQRIVDDMRAAAQTEAQRITARGEEQLANERESVVRELRGEVGGLAVELSERIVGERLADDANVQRTVEAFLADVDRGQLQSAQDVAGANRGAE